MDDLLHRQLREVGGAHWWYEGRRRIVEAELERVLPPRKDRTLLEVGCGSGAMLPMLARFGRAVGLEPDASSVAHCAAALGDVASVVCGRIPDDVPRDGSFDVVGAFDVLEHLPDDHSAVDSLRDALRPGGILVATVPAFPILWGRQDELSHHFRRYRRRGLCELMSSAGLEVRRITYFNTVLFAPVAAVRLARRLIGIGGTRKSDFDVGPGGARTTRVLAALFASERHLLEHFDLPFGVSLLAVATRPT